MATERSVRAESQASIRDRSTWQTYNQNETLQSENVCLHVILKLEKIEFRNTQALSSSMAFCSVARASSQDISFERTMSQLTEPPKSTQPHKAFFCHRNQTSQIPWISRSWQGHRVLLNNMSIAWLMITIRHRLIKFCLKSEGFAAAKGLASIQSQSSACCWHQRSPGTAAIIWNDPTQQV